VKVIAAPRSTLVKPDLGTSASHDVIMGSCKTCLEWLGRSETHVDKCPVRASIWCSQCGSYGHRPTDCGANITWTRPATLEELIPADVRARWNITTKTRIEWPDVDVNREIADINSIEIRYRVQGEQKVQRSELLDARLREFMKQHRIATTHSTENCLKTLEQWARDQGKKVRLVQERNESGTV